MPRPAIWGVSEHRISVLSLSLASALSQSQSAVIFNVLLTCDSLLMTSQHLPQALRIWALLREDFDQDGDGTITRDEFSEGFVKQALGEKGTALYNNRQSPAAWVRAIQTQANLAIVAYV